MIIDLIPSEFLFEFRKIALLTNKDKFNSHHTGKILKVFRINCITESGMMSSSCKYPCCGACFKIRQWLPQYTRDRKVWHIRTFNDSNFINYHSEPVAEINNRDVNCTARSSFEDKSGRIFFSSD